MEKKSRISGWIYAGAVLIIRNAIYIVFALVSIMIMAGILTLACQAPVSKGLPSVIDRELAKPEVQSNRKDLRFLLSACNENQKALESTLNECREINQEFQEKINSLQSELSKSSEKSGKFDGIKYAVYAIGFLLLSAIGLWLYAKISRGLL